MDELTFKYDFSFSVLDAEIYRLLGQSELPWDGEIVRERAGSIVWELRARNLGFKKVWFLNIRERPKGCVLEIGWIDQEDSSKEELEEALYKMVEIIQSHIETELSVAKVGKADTSKEKKIAFPKRIEREKWDYIKDKIIKPQVMLDPSLIDHKWKLSKFVADAIDSINYNEGRELPYGRDTINKIIKKSLEEIRNE